MSFKFKDFSIKTFNNDVNHSGDLDDKYIKWTEYRESISTNINQYLSNIDNLKSAIIFALGECNDLDLKFIINKFENIVLTDVDTDSIKEGIARQKIDDSLLSRTEIKQMEYTGLSSSKFFETLANLVSENTSIKKIIEYIETQTFENTNMMHEEFDFVLSCPIYTQLVYTQMEVLFKVLKQFKVYCNDDIAKINKTIYKYIPDIIKKYNDIILSALKPKGHIVVLTDIIEIPSDSKMIDQLKIRLSKTKVDQQELFEFVNINGLELGTVGYQDLIQKIKNVETFWSLWPFDEYKQYLVLMICGSK